MTASADLTQARAAEALVGILVPLCAVLFFYALGLVAAGASAQSATTPWQQLLALPSESDISRRAEGRIQRVHFDVWNCSPPQRRSARFQPAVDGWNSAHCRDDRP